MRNMKKILSLMIVCFLLLTMLSCAFSVYSAAAYFVYEGFVFLPNDQGEATICDYVGNETSLEIPENLMDYKVTAIADYAFTGNKDLTGVSFEKAAYLNYIGISAFSGCSSIEEIRITDSITSISRSAFQNCSALTILELGSGINVIPNQAFYGCTALENVEIPDNVQFVNALAFGNCKSLKTAKIADTVSDIGNGAFSGCDNLTIFGYADTAAEDYAGQNNIPFSLIEEDNFDVNMDGRVDILDVTLMQKYIADVIDFDKNDLELFKRCDVNRNGVIDITDATSLQKILAGIM